MKIFKYLKQKIFVFCKIYYLPIISGVIAGTSYIPFPPWALFFCFSPLFYFCIKNFNSPKRIFIGGWLCQFTFTNITFNWVFIAVQIYFQLGIVSALGLYLAFCSIAHLFFPLSLWVWSYGMRIKIFNNEFGKYLGFPLLLAVFMAFTPMIFKFNMGYPWFYGKLPAFHLAEIWGFEFLSTITLFLSSFFVFALRRKKLWIPVGLVLIFILNAFGFFVFKAQQHQYAQKINILLVQPNIRGIIDKPRIYSKKKRAELVTEDLLNMTSEILRAHEPSAIDVIIWPEFVYQGLFYNPNDHTLLRGMRDLLYTPLITGAALRSNIGRHTNSILFMNMRDENGKYMQVPNYNKNMPFPFSEYVPGATYFPMLKRWKKPIEIGDGPAVRKFLSLKAGLLICYESLFSWFSRKLSQRDANIFVNLSNDSWFGRHIEPYQHLYIALARGIENRRPFVRVTNTGISAVMTAEGEIIARSPSMFQKWTQVVSVPYHLSPKKTIYTRWGYYINHGFLIFIFLSIIFLPYVIKLKK